MTRQAESDLWRALLDLYTAEGVEHVLDGVLPPIVQATGARQAYIEIYDREGDVRFARAWDDQAGEVERIQVRLSEGIVAAVMARSASVLIRSARTDPDFGSRLSVQQHELESVICAPIGQPPRGVVYLQGEEGGLSEVHRTLAEEVGRYLAPLVDAVVARADGADDPCLPVRERLGCHELVGRSKALAGVLGAVEMVAALEMPVLLHGESGTGKSVLARLVHDNSSRRGKPFVTVNCPALPETLFERELFGAERGAYTGADQTTDGLLHSAAGGTLFLEEIGELATGNQAKLLAFLETGRYRRLGSTVTREVDVRVVAATNRDLESDPSFRNDLYYRLAGFPIRVPSLAERREDVVLLARAELERYARSQRRAVPGLSPAAMRELLAREWPGNVRQLGNVVRAGFVRASAVQAEQVGVRHLFPEAAADDADRTWQEQMRRFQRDVLAETLSSLDWNVAEAARVLDISRSRLYELLATLGIERNRD